MIAKVYCERTVERITLDFTLSLFQALGLSQLAHYYCGIYVFNTVSGTERQLVVL